MILCYLLINKQDITLNNLVLLCAQSQLFKERIEKLKEEVMLLS